eukprot:10516412-Heterocapsa_arctica.AAC.1
MWKDTEIPAGGSALGTRARTSMRWGTACRALHVPDGEEAPEQSGSYLMMEVLKFIVEWMDIHPCSADEAP